MKNVLNMLKKMYSVSSIRASLAFFTVFFVFAIMVMLMLFEIPAANKSIFDMALGSLLTVGFAVVFSYYFGSSKNESDKIKKENEKEEKEELS